MRCGEAISEDYPVAGAHERVGSADSENKTDSDDLLIIYESDNEIDCSGGTDDQ